MALMRGSPVLTDERFTSASREVGYSTSSFTVGGAVTATGVLSVLLFGAAAAGWGLVSEVPLTTDALGNTQGAQIADISGWVWVAAIAGLVFGLASAFKPMWAMITGPLYALSYGVFVGAISHVYNASYDGIVTQALFATVAILSVMLLLYATRIIKVTNRFVMVVVGATMGIFVMYAAAWVISLFSPQAVGFLYEPSPISIGISLFIIVIGALNLAIDFAFIEKAAVHQAPKRLEWYAAFGVMVTLVWIYLEVLRLLAILNRQR